MKLYVEGEIERSIVKSFENKDRETVEYAENVIITNDGRLQINSKETFEKVGVTGVATIEAQTLYWENGTVKGYRLVLKDFKEGYRIDGKDEIT